MPPIRFSHPRVSEVYGDLVVNTGVNDVFWTYALNTQTFPTYGGEVVQILSAFTDDLTVTGEIKTYKAMERIYEWFLYYFQVATQGASGETPYDQQTVAVSYPERGWDWTVKPKGLPGFRYGLEVVVPTWGVICHVEEEGEETKEMNIQAAIDGIKKLHPGIGYDPTDPFSSPFPENTRFDPESTRKFYEGSAEYFNDIIKNYTQGDYEDLLGEIGAKPAFLDRTPPKNQ
jgi:hypothetical protein